jgi:hypothetical protein
MEAGIAALGGLAAVSVVAGWGVVRRTPLDFVLGVFFATLAVSTLASGHPLEAGGWARPWVVVAYFGGYWWLRDRAHAARFARVLVAAGALAALYGILQHGTGVDWYRAALGRPRMVHPRTEGDEYFAVVGFFRNYLTYAHTMLFPFAWATALAARGSIAGTLAALLCILAIVYSTARGVWIASAVVAVAVAWLAGGRTAARALVALGAVALIAFAASPDLRTQAGAMFERGGENAGRIGIYEANLDVIHDHPVFGLGFGRYQRAALPYYEAHPDADRRSHAHSDYLQMGAEAGLAGLAAFMLLYLTALRFGWEAVRSAPDAESWVTAAGAWCGVVGFLVGGLTQYNFGDNEVAVAMWLALAVLMRCRGEA